MKRWGFPSAPATTIGLTAGILLAPQAALALDFTFIFDGVVGTFRGLEAGQTTGFPPAEAAIAFISSSGAPAGVYPRAPICIYPDCGFVSVTANGSAFTTPALFHGSNGGWQLLITPSSAHGPGPSVWPLYGSLTYCPGFEVDGDAEQCPSPGPGSEPRAGWLTPPPHPEPREDAVLRGHQVPAVPGALPFLGVGAAFRFSRRLRNRIRGRFSGSSRTAGAPPGLRRREACDRC